MKKLHGSHVKSQLVPTSLPKASVEVASKYLLEVFIFLYTHET